MISCYFLLAASSYAISFETEPIYMEFYFYISRFELILFGFIIDLLFKVLFFIIYYKSLSQNTTLF